MTDFGNSVDKEYSKTLPYRLWSRRLLIKHSREQGLEAEYICLCTFLAEMTMCNRRGGTNVPNLNTPKKCKKKDERF